MAGAGRRTFQPGEVLTASNVNSYLMDQSVMRFASSAARGSAVGTAVIAEGMVSYLDDANAMEFYDGTAWTRFAAGTGLPIANGGTGGTALAAAQDNLGIGMIRMIPATVNFSGGTATANTSGEIAFTSVTSLSLNNVFTSSYKKYLILYEFTCSTTITFTMRMRANGSDNTATQYGVGRFYRINTTTGAQNLLESSLTATPDVYGKYQGSLTLMNPATAVQTHGFGNTTGSTSVSANTNNAQQIYQFAHLVATAYDGFSILPSSGNITGTVQVFAYNE